MSVPAAHARRVPLVEVLDRVIDRGAVLSADASLGLADVDLIRVALRLVIAPADRISPHLGQQVLDVRDTAGPTDQPACRPSVGAAPQARPALSTPTSSPGGAGRAPQPVGDDPHGADRGLAQLVLTVVELLRELMDRQAVRRATRGTLSDEQVERLGVALMSLNERMDELVEIFGLDRRDLNLDLGPLGNLL